MVPLTSIVVEPSTPPAVSDNPPAAGCTTSAAGESFIELAAIVVAVAEVAEGLISTVTEYFETLP